MENLWKTFPFSYQGKGQESPSRRADGGNERDGVVGDRQACVSDGCGARRMMLGRW